MALDTTITSATYDSFFTIAEMELFIDRVHWEKGGKDRWDILSDLDKESVMKASVDYINNNEWQGTQNATIVVVRMLWPRDPYGITAPDEIGYASACYILTVLQSSGSGGSSGEVGAVKKRTVGDVTVEFDTATASAGTVADDNTCAEKYAKTYLIEETKSVYGIGGVALGRIP